MGQGLIQLVSNSNVEDLYLTSDPQITFFKSVFKRVSNFSTEPINQLFNSSSTPDFNERVTCTLTRHGDLIQQVYLVVTLPNVPVFYNSDQSINQVFQFKWVEKIGYAMIKTIELEIGGKIIDRHYGDWLNIWYELITPKAKLKSLNQMIGNVPELTEFSNGKNSYTLRIPLNFYFCNNSGLSLPLIAMQHSSVKIHVEFNPLSSCYILGPTHYMQINQSMVVFNKYELLRQVINNVESFGIFIYFDVATTTIQYIPINSNIPFVAPTTINPVFDYSIIGTTTVGVVTPSINATQTTILLPEITLSLQNANLLVNYVYLDSFERLKFAKSNHEYLITQVQMLGDKTITNTNNAIKLGFIHPVKEIIFRAQMDYLLNSLTNNTFNYTNLYVDGTNLIKSVQLIANGEERFLQIGNDYNNLVEVYKYHTGTPVDGVNVISFSLKPEDPVQPTGSINFSKIDNAVLNIVVDSSINYNNIAYFRCYAVCINVIRMINGICGVAFKN